MKLYLNQTLQINNTTTMKLAYVTAFTFLFIANIFCAQTVEVFEGANVRAVITTDGVLFGNPNSPNVSGYEVPKNSGKGTIYSTGIWMGGIDEEQNLYVAASTLPVDLENMSESDYVYGPVSNDYSNPEYNLRYNRLWKVSQAQIESHISNFSNSDYAMPFGIAYWPGNGSGANGESELLAPYVDVNSNGIYDPENGDYPYIRGDLAVYFIINDDRRVYSLSNGEKLGVEIHGMIYGFDSDSPILDNTVFVSLKAFNRKNMNLDNFYFGLFNEFDLGYTYDDYVGTDVERNMTYVYNGYDTDGNDGSSIGYGEDIPAQACILLNKEMTHSCYYENSYGVSGLPHEPIHFYNYLRGFWKDGTVVTYGGNGYDGDNATNYMFDGYPEEDSGWTQQGAGFQPQDCRMLMSAGPIDFTSETEFLCFDFAFVTSFSQSGAPLESLAKLRQDAEYVQGYYNQQNYDCSIGQVALGVDQAQLNMLNPHVYPNPASNLVTFQSGEEIRELLLFNAQGSLVKGENPNMDFFQRDFSELPKGIYFYRLNTKSNKILHGKLVLE